MTRARTRTRTRTRKPKRKRTRAPARDGQRLRGRYRLGAGAVGKAVLLGAGADVNARGRDGWTPLGLAVRSGAVATPKALLAAKAAPHHAGGNGKTPLEIATINKKKGLVELLQACSLGAS